MEIAADAVVLIHYTLKDDDGKVLDSSDGSETLDDIRHGRLTPEQRQYLDEYLYQYNIEYVYVGKYLYE